MTTETHPPGTLRATRPDGTHWIITPHDLMYSTVTMFATHFWASDTEGWQPVNDDDPSTVPPAITSVAPTPIPLPAEAAPDPETTPVVFVRVVDPDDPRHGQTGRQAGISRNLTIVRFEDGSLVEYRTEQLEWS